MAGNIQGKKVAILTENGFEQSELLSPKEALEAAGATVHVISPQREKVKAWDEDNWGKEVAVDLPLDKAQPEEYDALVIPGGVMNPDFLRINPACVAFAQHFLEQGKPVAAICHGPWLLVETGMISGRKMTSYHSIKTDLKNAGAIWVNEPVVADNGLITSRNPGDLDAFNQKIIEEIAEGIHDTTAQFNQVGASGF